MLAESLGEVEEMGVEAEDEVVEFTKMIQSTLDYIFNTTRKNRWNY